MRDFMNIPNLSPEIVVQENSIITWHIRDNRVEVFEARRTASD